LPELVQQLDYPTSVDEERALGLFDKDVPGGGSHTGFLLWRTNALRELLVSGRLNGPCRMQQGLAPGHVLSQALNVIAFLETADLWVLAAV